MEQEFLQFVKRTIPTPEILLYFTLPLLLYGMGAAWLSGFLKTRYAWRTAYTRKVFHFVIFTAAGILQLVWSLKVVVLFGVLVSGIVLYGVWRGKGHPFYESLARTKDAPKRSLFILIPLATTAAGGILANILFPPFAYIGYLAGGWGDAVGEPVGSRWGKHPYKVPSLGGIPATRTLEGSAAVFAMSFLVVLAALLVQNFSLELAVYTALACAAGGTATEAISHHGLDNLTMQIAASGIVYWILG
ncbi:MAG: hypothetical protein WD077_13165 [Bacteroidia bacterium]